MRKVEHKINFLDITITRDPNKLSIDIYRKPTYSDIIIPNDFFHPKGHKLPAIRYLYNRMNSYKLSPENLLKENNTMQQILHNNGFNTSIANNIHGKKIKRVRKHSGQNLLIMEKKPEPSQKL